MVTELEWTELQARDTNKREAFVSSGSDRTGNSNCPIGAPEEILAARQTRFSLPVMGTVRAVTELE